MPFIKTAGEALRTHICDFPGQFSLAPWRAIYCSPVNTRTARGSFHPFADFCPCPRPPRRQDRRKARKAEYIPPPFLVSEPLPSYTLFSTPFTVETSPHPAPPLQNWKVTLAYDGTEFRGWQVQPGERTVQGELQTALNRITGESPLPQGSGRTDAGVHALAQVASFALAAPIPAANLHRALNGKLPASIRILETLPVPASFHARHSTVAKTYEYRIFRGALCPPFLARYVYACRWPMDLAAMDSAASAFLGEHDFLSFAATDPDLAARTPAPDSPDYIPAKVAGTVRTLYSSVWTPQPSELGELLVYRVRGNGFLHHMVRNLVGAMIEVGRGKIAASQLPAILAARDRSAAGPTAPARGLFLHSVEYPAPLLP